MEIIITIEEQKEYLLSRGIYVDDISEDMLLGVIEDLIIEDRQIERCFGS